MDAFADALAAEPRSLAELAAADPGFVPAASDRFEQTEHPTRRHRCGSGFTEDELSVRAYTRRPEHRFLAPFCLACAPAWPALVRESGGPVQACGGCGRPVAHDDEARHRWSGHHWACGSRRADRIRRRVEREPRPCERCGEAFEPARSDTRFCSSRCRMAAHRA